MISETARADIEDMWAQGLKPTFADIIRLNAVALAAERAKAGFALEVLPRVAFLGSVAFREPTIGSEIWMAEAARLFRADAPETFMFLRAFSLSRPQSELPDAADEKAVLAEIEVFRASLGFATLAQIAAAVAYAVHGFDPEAGETPALKSESDVLPLPDGSEECFDIGLLRRGMLCRIGSAADLRNLPRRALREMVITAISRDTATNARKDAASLAEDDYLRTLDEITARLERAAANPETVVEKVVNPNDGIDPKDQIDDRNGKENGQNGDDEHGERCGHVSADVGRCLVSHGESSPSLKVG